MQANGAIQQQLSSSFFESMATHVSKPPALKAIKGRGALSNTTGRFSPTRSIALEDGWYTDDNQPDSIATEVRVELAKTIITKNNSPDVPFNQSINPYRGCEHGCVYCYARPSHTFWDYSAGLDFETKLIYKATAAELLEQTITKPNYKMEPVAIGSNTDPYQPIEKQKGITREILKVLQRHRHPFSIITKGSLIERDIDILQDMAKDNLCTVTISVTTLDNDLKRIMEPRAATPSARLKTIEKLSKAGIPVGVLVAPIIPAINDSEMESILAVCAKAGATNASYVFLRLPREVKDLFREWLVQHYPQRTAHVMNMMQQSRGGRFYDSTYGQRMKGKGPFAQVIEKRFEVACRKLGLSTDRRVPTQTKLERDLTFEATKKITDQKQDRKHLDIQNQGSLNSDKVNSGKVNQANLIASDRISHITRLVKENQLALF